VKSWFRHLLPYGLVRASQINSELVRIGLPAREARHLAMAPATAVRLDRLNFDLLPAGALHRLDCVIDVGANVGDWTADLLSLCQPPRIICVEPDPALASKLRRRFHRQPGVVIEQVAMGDAARTAEFKIMENPVLNSFREPAASMAEIYPEPFQVKQTIQVEVKPLDAIAPSAGRISILKIDAQGFEREVLAGARETLQRTDYIIMEVNFQPHYDGEAGFFELDTIMQKHGFCIGNYSAPKGGRRQALFADVLYLRKDS
jgi:FkbM family methyltransferase